LESDCLLRQFARILNVSDLEAWVTEKKSGVVGGGDKYGNDVVGLLARDR